MQNADGVYSLFFLRVAVVSGGLKIPEKSATPLLGTGSGVCVVRCLNPPITATIVHAQAASHAKTRASFRINDDSVVCSIRNYESIESQSLLSTQHHSKERKSETRKLS